MFQSKKQRKQTPASLTHAGALIRRILALVAGIFFLWLALQLMPRPGTPASSPRAHPGALVPANAPPERADSFGIAQTGQIIAGILLAVLVGFSVYHRKKTTRERPTLQSLKTLSRIQLGSNQHIYAVECGEDILLIGATPAHLSLLHRTPIHALTGKDQGPPNRAPFPYEFSPANSTTSNAAVRRIAAAESSKSDFSAVLRRFTSA